MRRTANGRSSVYQGGDGYWHGRVTVGTSEDGRPDRRHVMAKTKTDVTRKVRELERLRDARAVTKVGARWTVGQWLEHWLENVARPSLRPNAWDAYRTAVRKHAVPAIGGKRLADLRPEHLRALYSQMTAAGLSPSTAHQVHRTLHVAFEVAVESGYMPKNVATRKVAPKVRRPKVRPYEVEEVRKLIAAALQEFSGVRWVVALSVGLRQGELLALCWSEVDLDRGMITIDFSRARPRFRHGCSPPCGKAKPGWCPERVRTNPERGETKSEASHRTIGLPPDLVALLRDHREQQFQARAKAGTLWAGGDWVFTDRLGNPLNNSSEHYRWKSLIARAGVRDARLHDARHTAATMLLVLGVAERAVTDTMGWSSPKMTAVYQHVTDGVRRNVASKVGALLFDKEDEAPHPP